MRLTPVIALVAALAGSLAPPASAAAASRDLTSYQGLGAWVDLWDGYQWDHPGKTVEALRAQGVDTLYLETGNSGQHSYLFRPPQMAAFIRSRRKPEPYKGKGIRYAGEQILRKAGKAGKVGGAK